MSKYVKTLLTDHLTKNWEGVDNLLLVGLTGLDANSTVKLRQELRDKDMRLMVVKNSLARRATEGTALAPAFEGLDGPAAVMWGGEDIVSLAKELVRITKQKEYEAVTTRGGVMDGDPLDEAAVVRVSKLPSREEQLSILVGQILSPGASLAGALLGPGGALASQIKQKSEEEGGE